MIRNLLLILALALVTGCASTGERTSTHNEFLPDGKTLKSQTIVVTKTTDSPWVKKCLWMRGAVFGIKAAMIDPQTGTLSPTVEILNGDADGGAIPMTTGGKAKIITETFGTFNETLDIEKSMWGAQIAIFKYGRVCAGAGVDCKPAVAFNVNLSTPITPPSSIGPLKTTSVMPPEPARK